MVYPGRQGLSFTRLAGQVNLQAVHNHVLGRCDSQANYVPVNPKDLYSRGFTNDNGLLNFTG